MKSEEELIAAFVKFAQKLSREDISEWTDHKGGENCLIMVELPKGSKTALESFLELCNECLHEKDCPGKETLANDFLTGVLREGFFSISEKASEYAAALKRKRNEIRRAMDRG